MRLLVLAPAKITTRERGYRVSYVVCYHLANDVSSFQSSLSGHKNIVKYVDSSITTSASGVSEVLLLTHFCRGKRKGLVQTHTSQLVRCENFDRSHSQQDHCLMLPKSEEVLSSEFDV